MRARCILKTIKQLTYSLFSLTAATPNTNRRTFMRSRTSGTLVNLYSCLRNSSSVLRREKSPAKLQYPVRCIPLHQTRTYMSIFDKENNFARLVFIFCTSYNLGEYKQTFPTVSHRPFVSLRKETSYFSCFCRLTRHPVSLF